ncbi:MAG: BPTI/Kunitz domain-containing protein [candidate division NC10 bacterium]|nr:BPTI/Kunitz domain-containing protein [candidate division NC10 bacterium]
MPIASLSALLLLLGVFTAAEVHAAGGAGPAGPLPREQADTRCGLKPEPGPCKALFERYYYEEKSKTCRPFFWGGCNGAVPFETMAECEQACLSPQTLRMQDLKPLRGDVYAEVLLEFPKTWKRPEFLVEVDGREVPARSRSGGFDSDRQMESLIFFPGRPGRKRVTVTAATEGRRVETAGWLEWKPAPLVALIGHAGDRDLILEDITLVLVNVEETTLTFNGTAVQPESFGEHAKLLRFAPNWVSGRNVLTMRGTGPDGTAVSGRYTFVYAGDGTLVEGETAALDYGTQGSKSGPFFRVAVEGPAVVPARPAERESHVMSEDGWLGGETRLVQELKASAPGISTVRVFEKPHFLMPEALKREIVLRVIPKP